LGKNNKTSKHPYKIHMGEGAVCFVAKRFFKEEE